jgi:hypothetical protein
MNVQPAPPSFCSNCGRPVNPGQRTCSNCGTPVSAPELEGVRGTSQARADSTRKTYSLWRVGILSVITAGLYFFYWFGITWKQLQTETRSREHHPWGHVSALAVPIYGFYIVYDHFRTLRQLQDEKNVASGLVPGTATLMYIVATVLQFVAQFVDLRPSAYLFILAGLVLAVLVVWSQGSLNRYWTQVRGGDLAAAATGPGEILTVIGGVLTTAVFAFALLPIVPSVNNVFEANQISPLAVGQEGRGTIEGFFEVDGYVFDAVGGQPLIIETAMPIPGDPVEDTLIGLWDTDGTTLLESNDDFGDSLMSRIEWTAPRSGRYYITIENADGISTGSYIIGIRAGMP